MRIEDLVEEVRRLDVDGIRSLLDEAEEVLREEWTGGVVRGVEGRSAVIIGDVHGDFATLTEILRREDVCRLLEGDGRLVFLGDIVDRGEGQVESINLVLKLKTLFREKVVFIRGNHEPPPQLPPYPHDFPYVLKLRYGADGERLYQRYFRIFQLLPHAATTANRIFLVHGGLPAGEYTLDDLVNPDIRVLEDLLWSDPFEGRGCYPSYRGAGHQFGYDITEGFLRRNGLVMVVRGHEPCEGFKVNHEYRVLTLFSRTGPPYFNGAAGYLTIPLSSELRPIDAIKNVKLVYGSGG
ncbi:hypothetical protein B6U99_01165 [Candidatus Geothermarchaeota archaeon ex4572_27]|nr:MAG: hypothetical protein B6U99_01165 [Candidatus Geothermarchaeota archaeon ex4572_27]